MKPKSTLRNFLALSGSSLLAISSTHAGQTWDGTGADNNITTPENWNDDLVANFGSAITFAGNVRNAVFNDRAAASSFNAISFTNNGTTGRTNAFTLTGNSITLGSNISTTAVTTGPAITDVIDVDIILSGNNRTFTTNTDHNLTISGDISNGSGNGAFIKGQLAGTLTLSGNNTFAGAVTIQNGTLAISSIGNFGQASSAGTGGTSNDIIIGNGSVTSTLLYTGGSQTTNRTIRVNNSNNGSTGGATIINDGSGALTFNATTFNTAYTNASVVNRALTLGGTNGGSITGIIQDNSATNTVSVEKTGGGTWTLGGTNTYKGATNVTDGTLIINGATSSTSTVAVGASGTLGGGGTIGGTLAVTGKLSPGDSITPADTLTLGSSLTLNASAILAFGLGTESDLISFSSVADNLIGSGNATLELSLLSGFSYTNTYTIFQNTSTTGFTLLDITGYDDANYTANFFESGDTYQLNFTAVPEPRAALLGGLGLLALLRRRRN
jgi:autotransporter-associated beta strand protein